MMLIRSRNCQANDLIGEPSCGAENWATYNLALSTQTFLLPSLPLLSNDCSLQAGVEMAGKKRISSEGHHLIAGPVAPGTHVLLRGQGLIPSHCDQPCGLQPRVLRHRPCDFLLLIFRASLGHY